MPRAGLLRLTAAVVAALASALTVTTGPSQAVVRVPADTSSGSSVIPTSPTNAAKIFQWGLSDWEDEFIDPLSASWKVSDYAKVRNQNGMLTLEGTSDGQPVVARVGEHARRYGRWEARVRSNYDERGGTPYKVVWELVPLGRGRCGDGITLATYTVGDSAADMSIRGLDGTAFTDQVPVDLENYVWHTYAVEVTPDHISWFADTKVLMTERRPEALAGTRFRIRFRLEPVEGAKMAFTRMQMDWVRYYTLQRPGAFPVDAPEAPQAVDYSPSC